MTTTQPPRAAFFEDWDFESGSAPTTYGPGSYDSRKLQAAGLFRAISSIRVPAGLEVTLYKGDSYTLDRVTYTRDVARIPQETFNDRTSSLRIAASPTATLAPGDGVLELVGPTVDAAGVQLAVAQDPGLVENLAHVAHWLGFGWPHGSHYPDIGEGFDVSAEHGEVVCRARYNPYDPYAGDEADKAGERLVITLSNFRVQIDPRSMVYSDVTVGKPEDAVLGIVTTTNDGQRDDTVSQSFTYQLATTVARTTSRSFTEGFEISISSTSGVDAGLISGEITRGLGFSFSATQGWSNSEETTVGREMSITGTMTTPPGHQQSMQLVVTMAKGRMDYAAKAYLGFDIEFAGFLKRTGNARVDHPTDRPSTTVKFGTDRMTGFEHIVDSYRRREERPTRTWDWTWAESRAAERKADEHALRDLVEYFRQPIVVPIAGEISVSTATNANVKTAGLAPLGQPVPQPLVSAEAGVVLATAEIPNSPAKR